MHYAKVTPNEPSQIRHSKNKSVMPSLPPTQNKYICGLLESNNLIKSTAPNKQTITSYSTKISSTFESILASDQKRTDAMQLVNRLRHMTNPPAQSTSLNASKQEKRNNGMIMQLPFCSNIFSGSPAITSLINEYNDKANELNEKQRFQRKNKRKHLSQQEMGHRLENEKTTEEEVESINACSNKGGSNYDSQTHQQFNSPFQYKEILTKVIDRSPINVMHFEGNDNANDDVYKQERKESMTLTGTIRSKDMFVEHMNENIIILSNKKERNKELSRNDYSFIIQQSSKPKGFIKPQCESQLQFSFLSTIEKDCILLKPMVRQESLKKEVRKHPDSVIEKIVAIQKFFRRYMKKKDALTGLQIDFYYKGVVYARKAIDFNQKITRLNEQLKEIKLKKYKDNILQVTLWRKGEEVFGLESIERFFLSQSYSRPEEQSIIQKKEDIRALRVELQESITLSQAHSNTLLVPSILSEVNNEENSRQNENTASREERSVLHAKTLSFKLETNLLTTSIESNQLNPTTNTVNAFHQIKKHQSEKMQLPLLGITAFPEDDQVKQSIDDKPISKNKKKPKFADFDEKHSKSKEIEEATTQLLGESKKKANQLRKKMQSMRPLKAKLPEEKE